MTLVLYYFARIFQSVMKRSPLAGTEPLPPPDAGSVPGAAAVPGNGCPITGRSSHGMPGPDSAGRSLPPRLPRESPPCADKTVWNIAAQNHHLYIQSLRTASPAPARSKTRLTAARAGPVNRRKERSAGRTVSGPGRNSGSSPRSKVGSCSVRTTGITGRRSSCFRDTPTAWRYTAPNPSRRDAAVSRIWTNRMRSACTRQLRRVKSPRCTSSGR